MVGKVSGATPRRPANAAPRKGGGGRAAGATFDTVRRLAGALPGAEEGTSYGTPAFRVAGKLFARLREDGESLLVRVDFDERKMLMAAAPEIYFITDHYRDWPSVLVRLAAIDADELRDVLTRSWRRMASKRLLAAFDAQS